VWYAINKLKREHEGEDFYLRGMWVGIYTSAIAVFVFAVFVSLYLSFLDPEFMKYIQSIVSHGPVLTSPAICLILTSEGLASGAIITFSAMQFLKSTSHSHLPE
jgi:cell division protein FtsX